jgi:putative peptide maturation system protein
MMAPFSPSFLNDALDYLTDLATNDVDPAVARELLNGLRARHSEVRLRLVWQREEYDASLQYELLAIRASGDVVTLAYCRNRTLPWSFRGGHRASERLLLRVNGVPMELDQAIACLDSLWDAAPLTDRLVTACLLRQELDEAPVALSTEALQTAMDAFRRARGLLTAAQTTEWLGHRGLSHSDLERLVAAEAAVAVIRQRATEGHAPAYFEEHRGGLSTARVARLTFASARAASDAAREIKDGADFFAVAERSFVEGLLMTSPELFGVVRRDELGEEIGGRVFEAHPGATVGPVATDGGYAVIRVITVTGAVLDEATVALIERRLFALWLEARRRSARVEWFWGSAARTEGSGDPGRTTTTESLS